MSSQELLFCLGHCIVHCVKVMEELKMNRSEIFNFALRRCLYFTWCNNLFVNNSKVCVLPEISLHISYAIGPVRKQKLPYSSNLMTRQPSLCPTQHFTILVTGILPFHAWKGRRKWWSTFYFFSKYKLFVYGIELWKTARPIYFLFDLCGLKLSTINDAPDLMEICLNWYQDNK